MSLQVDFDANIEREKTPYLSLWEEVKEDWIAHGRDWTKPGFRAVAVYRLGVWWVKIPSKILRAPAIILYRMMFRKVPIHYGF